MTAVAVAVALHRDLALPDPHGPDPVVFGAPRSRQSLAELDALGTAASRAVYYACCQVRGTGLRCWRCGQAGQIAPEPERIEDVPAATAI